MKTDKIKESIITNSNIFHLVGIKGVGMTALAQYLNYQKKKVTGSDTQEKFFTDKILKREKIEYFEEFKSQNLPSDIEVLIHSDAYGDDNVEIKTAKEKGIPVFNYSKALNLISKNKHTIAVSGSHGKTTTSALLSFVMKKLNLDPTALIGSEVIQFRGNSIIGKSKYLVLEADEYKAHMLDIDPKDVFLTSLDYDHPDFYQTYKDYYDAFLKFIKKLNSESFLVAYTDDKNIEKIIKETKAKIIPVTKDELRYIKFKTHLIGEHNQLNCLAVFKYIKEIFKITDENIKKAISLFEGTRRRFEKIGEFSGALIFDDYAHHPEEIKVTLKAIREKYPKKNIWCIFHPHTYSRTKMFFNDFAKSFQDADQIIVAEIYSSAREKEKDISSQDLVKEIKKYNSQAKFIPTHSEIANFLKNKLTKKDLVVTMGAGDIWQVGKLLTRNND